MKIQKKLLFTLFMFILFTIPTMLFVGFYLLLIVNINIIIIMLMI